MSEDETSLAAGACVLSVVSGAALAGVFAVSWEAGVITTWAVAAAVLWSRARRRVSDSSATPPPEGVAPSGNYECAACSETTACPEGDPLKQVWKNARRICCRCQQGIKPGEPYRKHAHDRASGAPLVNYSHEGAFPRR